MFGAQTDPDELVKIFLLARLAAVIIGFLTIWLGYRLFVKATIAPTGQVAGEFGEVKLTFSNAAPGTFFVLLGAAIIFLAISRSISVETTTRRDNEIPKMRPAPSAIDTLLKVDTSFGSPSLATTHTTITSKKIVSKKK